MILVYTQELDNAIIMAASLAGIQTPAGNIKLGDLELHKLQIKQDAENFGYIKSSLNNEDAVFIWGSNVIRVAKPSDYGFKSSESDGFFPPNLKYLYVQENEAHAKRLIATLKQEENNIIYDASIGLGGKFIFSSLYSFAGLELLHKQIHRVEVLSLTEDGINKAFSNPKTCEESIREILRNQTQQYIYYLANNNLPLLIPGQSAYPRTKDLRILDELVKRNDQIEEEIAKEKYTISLKAISSFGDFVLQSKNAVFSKKEPAREFVSHLPAKTTVRLITSTEYTKCDGPHSAISIMKAAQSIFHYPPQKTGIILEELQAKGLINSSSSAARVLPNCMEEELRDILNMLSSFPNIYPYSLKASINRPFEPKVMTDTRNCGIIPTKRKPTGALSEAQRNIYSLIAKEFIKCVLGKKVQEKIVAQINTQGIIFSATGHILKFPGFSILDGKPLPQNPIPEGLSDNEEVQIQYILEKKTGTPPKPFLELDIRKKFSDGSAKSIYSPAELSAAINDMEEKKLIMLKGKSIYPLDCVCQLIHELNDYEGLIQSSIFWEESLNKISNIEEYSYDDAITLSSNLILKVKEELRAWLNQKLNKTGIQTSILCPTCGKFLTSTQDALICSHCGFKVLKIQFGKRLSPSDLEELLKKGSTSMISGFTNIEGSEGRLYLTSENKVAFSSKSQFSCPICSANPSYKNGSYYCTCGLEVKQSYYGHLLNHDEIYSLFSNGKTPIISDLMSNGNSFKGILYIDNSSRSIKCIAIEESS